MLLEMEIGDLLGLLGDADALLAWVGNSVSALTGVDRVQVRLYQLGIPTVLIARAQHGFAARRPQSRRCTPACGRPLPWMRGSVRASRTATSWYVQRIGFISHA